MKMLISTNRSQLRELSSAETAQVSGGLLMGAPVVFGMLADTGFYGAMTMSFGVGFSLGSFFDGLFGMSADGAPTSCDGGTCGAW